MDNKGSLVVLSIAIVVAAAILSGGMIYGNAQQGTETTYYALAPAVGSGEGGANLAGAEAVAIPLQITENVKTISVSGGSEIAHEAEKVDLLFAIETDSLSAADAQQQNATTVDAVRNALVATGIAREDIETASYGLQEKKEYNSTTRTYYTIGYRSTHSLKVSLRDTGKAGSVIDTAANAGATRVDSISFGLTNATVDELRKQALEQAAKKARDKADSIARGLNVSITGIQLASESTSYSPYYDSRNYAMDAASGEAAPTEFISGDVKVSANVSVQFTIG